MDDTINFENKTLNKRQETILQLFETGKNTLLSVSHIQDKLPPSWRDVPLITLKRDLKKLVDEGYLETEGQGRSVRYHLSFNYVLRKPVDSERYFKTPVDRREGNRKFNFSIFNHLKAVFSKGELETLMKLNEGYRENRKHLSKVIIEKEMERLIIELSWKSSQIEGNTYSLLETESLSKRAQRSARAQKR